MTQITLNIEDDKVKVFIDFIKTINYISLESISKIPEFTLTEEHLQILNERRAKHRSGESKSHTWEEVKANARKTRQENLKKKQ